MELKDLRYFVTVYEANCFLRASHELHTVQSNVSARIKKLEEYLGERVFTRLHRGVQPTALGRLLYPDAKQLIALASQIEGNIRAATPVRLCRADSEEIVQS